MGPGLSKLYTVGATNIIIAITQENPGITMFLVWGLTPGLMSYPMFIVFTSVLPRCSTCLALLSCYGLCHAVCIGVGYPCTSINTLLHCTALQEPLYQVLESEHRSRSSVSSASPARFPPLATGTSPRRKTAPLPKRARYVPKNMSPYRQ